MSSASTPAQRLVGLELADGWKVTDQLKALPGATGGNFSTPYEVKNSSGEKAFLKAIDLHKVLRQDPGNVARALQKVTTDFNYERDLLAACADKKMSRVVRALGSGEHVVDPSDPASVVFYLIFELATGDIRQAHDLSVELDLSRIFRNLHDVATAIRQLHAGDVAHQDVKPSNVLTFQGPSREVARVADLGRASLPTVGMGHDMLPFAGDPAHAPPEGLYGSSPPDWAGRKACDMYHLGSLLLFLFTGVGTTAALIDLLDPLLLPRSFGGAFTGTFEDVLPFLRDANRRICEDFPQIEDSRVRAVAIEAFQQLCDPDPKLRGHPSARRGHQDPYSVARYISLFDLEARRTLHQMARKSA